MKILNTTAIALLTMCILVSCQKDLPKPETNKTSLHKNQVVEVSGYRIHETDDPFFIRHLVKGKDVFIECIVKGASFRNNGAKIILSIDGKQKQTINNAAFVVKGLTPGKHLIKLELFKENNKNAASLKEFEVVIP